MERWVGQFIIQRIVANLNEANWATLIDVVSEIQGVNDYNQPYEQLHWRGDENRFGVGTGEYDEDDNEILAWYSNAYIYAASFSAGAVDFDKFQNWLVNLFNVNPNQVTYTTAHNPEQSQRYRPSTVATYKYDGKNRIRIALMGCTSNSELCTRKESNEEVLQVLSDNRVDWGEVGT